MKDFDLLEVKQFIASQSPETKVYLGCDSERIRVKGEWFADYILAVVVHIDGKHGCKLFGKVVRERDYEKKLSRPKMRMMTEAFKLSELYMDLADVLAGRPVELHLDINPNELHGSSCAIQEAIGYIRGTCNVVPMVKPQAFAASYAADRMKGLRIA
jgi:predicted RNase H-related nuclease YkuK (DUF458 family)